MKSLTVYEQVIEEIRASRRRMSEECGHDPDKLIDYLKTFEGKYSRQIERYRNLHKGPGRELTPQQEAEIKRRVRLVKQGKAKGRPAKEALADIEAKIRRLP